MTALQLGLQQRQHPQYTGFHHPPTIHFLQFIEVTAALLTGSTVIDSVELPDLIRPCLPYPMSSNGVVDEKIIVQVGTVRESMNIVN